MKKLSLYLIIVLYVLAGINHFIHPHFYEGIMPAYIGYHSILIAFSGVCEILLGLLMIPQATRKIAAWLIVIMLIVFLWIHVQMIIDFWKNNDKDLWIAIIRLPLQFVLIWWAYTFTKTSPART